MTITWHLEKRKLSDLTDHPRNPRKLSKDDAKQLKESLQKFGVIDKPVITPSGMIIGGHQRKQILKKLAVKEIECWVPDRELTDKEVDELNIRLNKNQGEWDFEKLANEWEITDLLDWGFSLDEFGMGGDVVDEGAHEELDSETLEPGKDEDARTRPGDSYDLISDTGSHRLVCGDSTSPDVVLLCLQGATPILMVTDPPYGVEYDADWRIGIKEAKAKVRAKGKVQNDDKVNWSLAWHLFPGCIAYVWHAGKYCGEIEKSLTDNEYEIISQIVWAKQHFALSRGDYHWQHEPCWYAVKKGHNHNWQGARDQSTIWQINSRSSIGDVTKMEESFGHPTQKPLECMARPIRNNTAPGEGVYDPFLGSGTTLIAAEQLGRQCFGIEISPAYCDIIVNRWIKYMQKNNREAVVKRNGQQIDWEAHDAKA